MTPNILFYSIISPVAEKLKKLITVMSVLFQRKPFLANILILYPLKTPGNIWFSCVCMRYKMRTSARNGLGFAGRHVVMRKCFSFKDATIKVFPIHFNPF